MREGGRPGKSRGITFLEVLLGLAILAVMAGLAYPALQRLIHRSALQGVANETAVLMRLARLEAIRGGRPARVEIHPGRREVSAFFDEDADGVRDASERRLGLRQLPAGIDFAAPPDLTGLNSVDGLEKDAQRAWATFNPDGSAIAEGALRFGDRRDNYLETRLAPRTNARVVIRKWDGAAWREEGEGGVPWGWN